MNQYKRKKHYNNLSIWTAGIMGSLIIPTLAYFTYMEFDNGNYGQSFMCALSLVISSYFPITAIENHKMKKESECELNNLETKL